MDELKDLNIDQVSKGLIKSGFFNDVLYDLYNLSVISEELLSSVISLESTNTNKARIIIQHINKSEVFIKTFIEILYRKGITDSVLREASQAQILPNMQPSSSLPSLSLPLHSPAGLSDHSQSIPNGLNELQSQPLAIKVILGDYFFATEQQDSKCQIYRNLSMPRGLVFIANFDTFDDNVHQFREGSAVDVKNLTNLFTQMGYLVLEPKINLKRTELIKALNEFRDNEKLFKVDSCIVVIMSHGIDRQHFYTSDNLLMDSERVTEKFNNTECHSLINKPKIFIFQFCRGMDIDKGLELNTVQPHCVSFENNALQTDGEVQGKTIDIAASISARSEMLIIYSTLIGYVSNRHADRGSWLIEDLCIELMNHAHNTDLETLMKYVSQRVRNRLNVNSKQVPEKQNIGFDKHFYFNPEPLREPLFADFLDVSQLADALPQNISGLSFRSQLTPTFKRRSWLLESGSTTPDYEDFSPYALGFHLRKRNFSGNSNSSSISRDQSPFSPRNFDESVRPKSATALLNAATTNAATRKSRRTSTPCMPIRNENEVFFSNSTLDFNCNKEMTSSSASLGNGNLTPDEVSQEGDVVDTGPVSRKFRGTATDFLEFRKDNCKNRPPQERPPSLKRSLSGPNESEAMKKLHDIRVYLTINDHDPLIPFLKPIEEQLTKDKNKGKRRKDESSSLEY